ncbi:hypothetical protein GCM10007884_49850 [Methylobacterium brachythecii]|uniref:Uncharacterized protein n=1 Tax=Methylobacterium brachythecii TaxID=1176177 RepID=A0ABQ6DAG2_9HYPH|nr:hypothetical protein GCM10007884_49850 [Methylobacterium brachythecii]
MRRDRIRLPDSAVESRVTGPFGDLTVVQSPGDKARPEDRRSSGGEGHREGEREESEDQGQGSLPSALAGRGDRLAGKP